MPCILPHLCQPGTVPATSSPLGRTARAAGGLAAGGLLAGGYAWWEARWFTLRRVRVPVLPPGAPELRVLHLSDLHLSPYQHRKRAWLASLAALEPDLVVDTGDNLAHADAVGPLLESLGALLARPGVFVLGSNDYFSPGVKNPVRYLLPDTGYRDLRRPLLPWPELVARLVEAGWSDLTNRRANVTVKGVELAFTGVDDPHLRYDDLAAVAGPADPEADLRVAVTHAPYLRVLDQFTADGHQLVLAGHTDRKSVV